MFVHLHVLPQVDFLFSPAHIHHLISKYLISHIQKALLSASISPSPFLFSISVCLSIYASVDLSVCLSLSLCLFSPSLPPSLTHTLSLSLFLSLSLSLSLAG